MTGLIGEEIVDDRVWIIKSHHPIRIFSLNYNANKIVYLTRNPFDILASKVNFFVSMTHSKSIVNDLPKEDPEFFDAFFREALAEIKDYMEDMMQEIKSRNVPCVFLKFEELRNEPRESLREVFSFLLDIDDITGTVIEKRIDDVIAMGHSATVAYKLKPKPKAYKTARDMFTKEQQRHLFTTLYDYLKFYGYIKTGNPETDKYAVFEESDFEGLSLKHTDVTINYKQLNKQNIEWNVKMQE